MKTEKLNIYDENQNHLGIETREEVHRKGHWHETFHCWIVSQEEGAGRIHLQLRSSNKKDFPGLLDITAAGHLLSTETVREGMREVEEELGLALDFEDLVPLGVIKDQIHQADFIDNEHCHNFLYRTKNADLRFELQKEEVAGMVSADFQAFTELCIGKREHAAVEGFKIASDGTAEPFAKTISKKDMVPHSPEYLKQVASRIKQLLEKK